MVEKAMKIKDLRTGDCVVTELGTGFVERWPSVIGMSKIRVRLDNGDRYHAQQFETIVVINGAGVNVKY